MRRYLWIYILISVFVAIWGIRALMNDPVVTQTARAVEYENKITASGYIVRDEVVYYAQSAGVAESAYQNEARVSKGKRISTIYTDGISPEIKQAMNTVNAKIRRLEEKTSQETFLGTDLSSTEEKISNTVDSVVKMTLTGDFEELDIAQAELAGYVHISNVDTLFNPTEDALNELYAQKKALEASVQSAKQDVYSTIAGVFVTETDGYEQDLSPRNVEKMTVEDFNAIKIERDAAVPESLNAGDRICKVVDNSKWYFTAVVTEEHLSHLSVGKRVWLRFPEIDTKRYAASVAHISAVEDGKVVVMVECPHYIKDIYTMRNTNCDIITHLFNGYQIPPTAVRVDDEGNTGVYVDVSGIVRFREIDILYQNDNVVIVDKSERNGYIKQYDAVIVGGKNIESGAVLK